MEPKLYRETEGGTFGDIRIIDGDEPFAQVQPIFPSVERDPVKRGQTRNHRADQLVEAYNSTYGEGINPKALPMLFKACEDAKKHLELSLVEPGRTVFWDLVEALKIAKS